MKKHENKTGAMYRNFVKAYIANGRNGKAAYLVLRPKTRPQSAEVLASKLLRNIQVQQLLTDAEEKLQRKFDVTAERVLQEVSRLAFVDIRKLYNEDGVMKSPHELDDDTAAALAAVDSEELFEGRGAGREHVGTLRKVKLFNKPESLRDLMKYFGLFAKDNKQRTDPLLELLATVGKETKSLPIRKA